VQAEEILLKKINAFKEYYVWYAIRMQELVYFCVWTAT